MSIGTSISLKNALDLPWWMKLLAVAALAGALWAGFAWWRAGVVKEGWDARDATAKVELAQKQQAYDALAARVREQNLAVESLERDKAAADERRRVAEAVAAGVIKGIDKRAGAVAASTATNCDGVMRQAWEQWK